jgi:hypothetical protein
LSERSHLVGSEPVAALAKNGRPTHGRSRSPKSRSMRRAPSVC